MTTMMPVAPIIASAVRATFMEQMVRHHPTLAKTRDAADEAFMVGILSLLDTLYDVPMEDLVESLSISENVAAALVRREGRLGELLTFVEYMERLGVDAALDQVQTLQMTREQVLEAQWKAFAWRSPSPEGGAPRPESRARPADVGTPEGASRRVRTSRAAFEERESSRRAGGYCEE